MSDLAAFLKERIEEDEQAARAAIEPSEMHPWGNRSLPRITPDRVPDEVRGLLGGTWGEHFARWDPARVLADVQVKRAVIDELMSWPHADLCCYACGTNDCGRGCDCGLEARRERLLRVLANAYADHV